MLMANTFKGGITEKCIFSQSLSKTTCELYDKNQMKKSSETHSVLHCKAQWIIFNEILYRQEKGTTNIMKISDLMTNEYRRGQNSGLSLPWPPKFQTLGP